MGPVLVHRISQPVTKETLTWQTRNAAFTAMTWLPDLLKTSPLIGISPVVNPS